MTKPKVIIAYGVIDSQGELISDMMGRFGYRVKSKANSAAKRCRGKVVKLKVEVVISR